MLSIITLDIKAFSIRRLMLKVLYFLGFMEATLLNACFYVLNVLSRLLRVLIYVNGKYVSVFFS